MMGGGKLACSAKKTITIITPMLVCSLFRHDPPCNKPQTMSRKPKVWEGCQILDTESQKCAKFWTQWAKTVKGVAKHDCSALTFLVRKNKKCSKEPKVWEGCQIFNPESQRCDRGCNFHFLNPKFSPKKCNPFHNFGHREPKVWYGVVNFGQILGTEI